MSKEFKQPDFAKGILELRYDDEEVCIYATEAGLRRLMDFCQSLLAHPRQGHIHLEDNAVLTENSLKGVLAIFASE